MIYLTQVILHPTVLSMMQQEHRMPGGIDDEYVVHTALSTLFGKFAARFKTNIGTLPRGQIEVLFYTRALEEELWAATTGVDERLINGIISMKQKTIDCPAGWTVRFKVTACPQRQVTQIEPIKGSRRVNVVPAGATPEQRADACIDWARDRLETTEFGEVKDLYLEDYDLLHTFRNTHGQREHAYAAVTLPKAVFVGVLRIQDPIKMETLLLTGIGKQKGLGFGFLSLFAH